MVGEGDLFEAPQPQPYIDETFIGLDPVMAAISMISCADEVISPEGLKVADFQSLQNDQLLNEVYYECEKDLLEKAALERPLPEDLNIEIPVLNPDENQISENKPFLEASIQKSTSLECLSSMDLMQGPTIKPSFIDFSDMDFSSVYGMRRAFSEGDIKVRLLTFDNFFYPFNCLRICFRFWSLLPSKRPHLTLVRMLVFAKYISSSCCKNWTSNFLFFF